MFEIFLKFWFFVIILPFLIVEEGWNMFRKFMGKRGYKIGPISVWSFSLLVAIVVFIILLIHGNFFSSGVPALPRG